MTSKKIFSWSKRQSGGETYYRTGGLLPIDTGPVAPNHGAEVKTTYRAGRTRPSPLTIVPHDEKQLVLTPSSASYSSALTNAASSLQTAFNDMLRSPAPHSAAWTRPVSLHKPLPGRPRSLSLPSSPDLPVELPGSILLENQGFPSCVVEDYSQALPSIRPVSHIIRRETHPPDSHVQHYEETVHVLEVPPYTLTHSSSVPDIASRFSDMRSVRSANALNAQANPQKVNHKKSLGDVSSKKRSRPNLVTSPSSNDSSSATRPSSTIHEVSAKAASSRNKASQPSPMTAASRTRRFNVDKHTSTQSEVAASTTPISPNTHSKQIEELKATVAAQDQTISSLQAQFGSLRASNEAHVTSLTGAHVAEVAALKTHARILEEQLAHRPSLHHASSNNLLFYLDTSEPHTPTRERQQSNNSNSTKSIRGVPVKEQQSSQKIKNSPEMESLKRKLTTTRRPETTNRNLLPELNQYKQNNVALQKQIESLMAKLNESKKSERTLKTSLTEAEKRCDELQVKVQETSALANGAQALQNTIDHLESRLEIANVEKIDAQEQLSMIQTRKSPFDLSPSTTDIIGGANKQSQVHNGPNPSSIDHNAHMSMSTVFSAGSPVSPEVESQELSTIAAFIARIERLQDQSREKDARISELEVEKEHIRLQYEQLEQEQKVSNAQMELQNDLLKKSRQSDIYVEQMRSGIINREAIIEDKEKAIRTIERQLDLHKYLLQAEIRRNAAITLSSSLKKDPLPELNTLASKSDIDRWTGRLQERLRREIVEDTTADPIEARIQSLTREVDFYIREIIFYKLDIRGYKSDIKQLKRITAQLGNYGRTSDLDSETSSLRPSSRTPLYGRSVENTPELPALDTSSPPRNLHASKRASTNVPITPPLSGSATQGFEPPLEQSATERRIPDLHYELPATPQTPARTFPTDTTTKNNDANVAPISIEQRKPVLPSRDSGRPGFLLTNFPLSTPAVPEGHLKRRSSSESTIKKFTDIEKPLDIPSGSMDESNDGSHRLPISRGRSASLPENNKGRMTPERPPRPRYGLFDSSNTQVPAFLSPPRTNVFSEAMRASQNTESTEQPANSSSHDSNISSKRIGTILGKEDLKGLPITSPVYPITERRKVTLMGSNKALPPIRTSLLPERKLSAASASSVPFVIGMGSPHNPALISPTTVMSPESCTITRNAPSKIPTTSRTGVGGTMASSTPVTSPVYPPETSGMDAPWRVPTWDPPAQAASTAKPTRKFSLSRKQEEPLPRTPRTPSHARNVSASSSIRTAFRLPTGREKEDTHKMRKDSISMPQPLGSPFRVERSGSTSTAGRKESVDGGKDMFGEAF